MSIRGLRKDENQGTFFRRSRVSGLTVAQVALNYLMRSIVPAASPQLRRTNAAAPTVTTTTQPCLAGDSTFVHSWSDIRLLSSPSSSLQKPKSTK